MATLTAFTLIRMIHQDFWAIEHHQRGMQSQLDNASHTSPCSQDQDSPMIYDRHALHVRGHEMYSIAVSYLICLENGNSTRNIV